MNYILLFFKSQYLTIFFGFIGLVLPYYLICTFMPKIPYMHWFFILVLFLIKLLVVNDKKYQKRLKPRVQSELAKELKKNPSNDLIFKRLVFYTRARDFNFALFGILILILAIVFKQF